MLRHAFYLTRRIAIAQVVRTPLTPTNAVEIRATGHADRRSRIGGTRREWVHRQKKLDKAARYRLQSRIWRHPSIFADGAASHLGWGETVLPQHTDGHRLFITEEDDEGIYGFCETCPDHHDLVIFKRDGRGSTDGKPRSFPSHHAWRTWRKGTYIFRADGV
jgi:hypothetical protein